MFAWIVPAALGQEVLHAFVGDNSQFDGGFYKFDALGDVNGDHVPDFIYGSPGWQMHRVRSGADWSTLARYRSTETTGYHDSHGHGVAGIGLWDGDFVPDYAVGAPSAFTQQFYEGYVRIFSGRTHELIQEITEHLYYDNLGHDVFALGDLDGDGHPELAATGTNHYYVRIYSAPDGTLLRQHDVVNEPQVAPYGDLDGDGGMEYLIGSYYSGFPKSSGQVHLYSGKTGAILRTFDGQRMFENVGVSVCAAGDWNGDGIVDVAAGGPGSPHDSGGQLSGVYVYSAADASVLRFFDGAEYATATSGFGYSIASGKDVNGDDFPDLLVGAPAQTFGDFYYRQGAIYLISGRTGAVLWCHRGPDDFDYNLGRHVYLIDDHDGDGLDEWVVSDPSYLAPTHQGGGRITLYRGSAGDRRYGCPTTPNSAGDGARLFAAGPISLRNNDLQLSVEGAPPSAPGFFVYGLPGPALPFDEGTLCIRDSVHVARHLVLDASGAAFYPLDLWSPPFSTGPGAIAPGDARAFQLLYTDAAATSRNASDSIVIRFVP